MIVCPHVTFDVLRQTGARSVGDANEGSKALEPAFKNGDNEQSSSMSFQ